MFPRFARSKAEMVAAGVIPIDRLTDVRAPVEVVAARCGAPQLAAVYGLRFVAPGAAAAAAEGSSGSGSEAAAVAAPAGTWHVSAVRVLAALAVTRGWVSGSGLPDEARAGRQILKDYTSGKLLFCQLPPGHPMASFAPAGAPSAEELEGMQLQQRLAPQPASSSQPSREAAAVPAVHQSGTSNGSSSRSANTAPAGPAAGDEAGGDSSESTEEAGPDPSSSNQEAADGLQLDMADLELLDELGGAGAQQKSKRADYKFHKKAARSKGSRGQEVDAGGYDGAPLLTGKKGGLVRVAGY